MTAAARRSWARGAESSGARSARDVSTRRTSPNEPRHVQYATRCCANSPPRGAKPGSLKQNSSAAQRLSRSASIRLNSSDLTAVKRSNGSGQSSDPIQMPLSAVSFFIDLAQAPSAELSNCFQECVARRIAGREVALHNRLLDERSKHLHDLI